MGDRLLKSRSGEVVASGSYALTVSGTNWNTEKATGIPYKLVDGSWRIKFNIVGSLSVSASAIDLTIAGLTFLNIAGGYPQAVSCDGNATQWANAHARSNIGQVRISSGGSNGWYSVSGDVELDSKPTFVA